MATGGWKAEFPKLDDSIQLSRHGTRVLDDLAFATRAAVRKSAMQSKPSTLLVFALPSPHLRIDLGPDVDFWARTFSP